MAQWSEDLISVESARTLDGLFLQRVRRSGEALAYRSYDRAEENWQDLTWEQIAEWVGHVSPQTTRLYTHFNIADSK